MREFTSKIVLFPVADLPEGATLATLDTGSITGNHFLVDSFEFEPETDYTAAGTLYICDKVLITDPVNVGLKRRFQQPVSCIVQMWEDSGTPIYVGTLEIPARVTIEPYLQRARLNIRCNMLSSPF